MEGTKGYDILIRDATIVSRPGKWFKGYIYINKGKIVDVGKGAPPDDYNYAVYIINGKNRIVIPGLICPLMKLSNYPSRFGGAKASRYDEIYMAAQMAIQDLLLSGITSVGTIEDNVDPVARAVMKSGIRAVIFVDADKGGWKDQLKIMLNRGLHGYEDRIFVGIYTEDNEEAIRKAIELDVPLIAPRENAIRMKKLENIREERGIIVLEYKNLKTYGLMPSSKTSNLWNILRTLYYLGEEPTKLFERVTMDAAKILKLRNVGEIREGNYADITIFDVSEPPGWTAGKGNPEEVIIVSNPRVETTIVAGEVVVDSYQMLSIGAKDVEKARRMFGES